MNHHASPDFWACYRALPTSVQKLADKAFALLKANPLHPSLHFKKLKDDFKKLKAKGCEFLGIETFLL